MLRNTETPGNQAFAGCRSGKPSKSKANRGERHSCATEAYIAAFLLRCAEPGSGAAERHQRPRKAWRGFSPGRAS